MANTTGFRVASLLGEEEDIALLNRPGTRWAVPNRTVTMIDGPPKTADWRDSVRAQSTTRKDVQILDVEDEELPPRLGSSWHAGMRPPRSAMKKEMKKEPSWRATQDEQSLLAALPGRPKSRVGFFGRRRGSEDAGSRPGSRPGTRGSAGSRPGSRPGSQTGSRPGSRGSDILMIDQEKKRPSLSGKMRAAVFATELFANAGKSLKMLSKRGEKDKDPGFKGLLDQESKKEVEAHEEAARQAVYNDPHGGTIHHRLQTKYVDQGRNMINDMFLAEGTEEVKAAVRRMQLDARPGAGGGSERQGKPKPLPNAWTTEVAMEIQACGSNAQGALGLDKKRGDLNAPLAWDHFDMADLNLPDRVLQIAQGWYHGFIVVKEMWDAAAPPPYTVEDFRDDENSIADEDIAQLVLDWASPEFKETSRKGGMCENIDDLLDAESRRMLIGLWLQMVEMRRWGGVKTTRGLFSWGSNQYGQLGFGDHEQRPTIRPMIPFVKTVVEQVSCGAFHTIISLGPRGLLACGLNRRGQLGTGTCQPQDTPAILLPFTPVSIREELDTARSSPSKAILVANLDRYASEGNVQKQFKTFYGYKGTLFRWFDRTKVLNGHPGRPACVVYFENEMAAAQAMTESEGQSSDFCFDGMKVSYFHPHYAGQDTRARLMAHTEEYMLKPGVFVKRICCGFDHTMVLMTDGTVIGWGNNRYGQVGTPKIDGLDPEYVLRMSTLPDEDPHLTELKPKMLPLVLIDHPGRGKVRVKYIATGGNHTMFGLEDGRLMACGRNDWGQLGLGPNAPASVHGVADVMSMFKQEIREVVCGASTTFCILHDQSGYGVEGGHVGEVLAFGRNDLRQLGIFTKGTKGKVSDPTQVDALKNKSVITISANEHTVVVCENSEVFCFGLNESGQMGLGDRRKIEKPEKPEWNKQDTRLNVTVGAFHSLYLHKLPTASGHTLYEDCLYSTGYNKHGELGLGYFTESMNGLSVGTKTPALVPFFHNRDVLLIAVGWYHTIAVCAQVATGSRRPPGEVAGEKEIVGRLEVVGFGYNKHGQLGLGHSEDMKQAMKLPLLTLTTSTPPLVRKIACGGSCSFFITHDNQVLAAGCNSRGQLGLGSFKGRAKTPVVIKTLTGENIDEVVCGFDHCFAIHRGNLKMKLFAFGANAYGQLGLGMSNDVCTPKEVSLVGMENIDVIACGGNHSMLICGGRLLSCGRNDYGQCGNKEGDRFSFTSVTQSDNAQINTLLVRKVACGASHTMVVRAPNVLMGFGRNDMGQIGATWGKSFGDNPPTEVRTPMIILDAQRLQHHKIKHLVCGSEHTVLVLNDGSIIATGCNSNGQLGLGHTRNQNTFAQLPVDGRRAEVYAGAFHTSIRYRGEYARKNIATTGFPAIASSFCSIS